MKKFKTYWQDHVSIAEMNEWHNKQFNYRKVFINIVKLLEFKSILDVGCGTGNLKNMLDDAGFIGKYLGTEITEKFVNHNISERIPCIKCDIVDMPLENESYEIVMCADVFNHLVDWRSAMRELIRVSSKMVFVSFFVSTLRGEDSYIKKVHKPNGKVILYNHINNSDLITELESMPDIEYGFLPTWNDDSELWRDRNDPGSLIVFKKEFHKALKDGGIL